MGSDMHARLKLPVALALAPALVASCASDPRRFALADPVWEDADRNHVPETPSKYWSGLMADGADMMVFYPLVEATWLPLAGEAVNVNSMDEVPNSSWFTNRIGQHPMTAEEAASGPCTGPGLQPKGPWTVVAAKPNGANPGFFIKASDGRRYLLKFDGPVQPQRATAADVIGSKIYYAAGFNVPCNQVVYFQKDILRIDPEATSENVYGEDVPIQPSDIDQVLAMAYRRKDGWLRASASQFVDGRPIGPFTYQGTRSDDPNDVIPHEDRRELRGARLLAAWLNHFDTREQNSLDVWTKQGGREFLRHYYIDFGDCFGSRWPTDAMSRRMGRSYYLDFGHVVVDFLSLGFWPRPWDEVKVNADAEIFGYFGHEQFEPLDWKGGYRNPAFARMNSRDGLWMARILQRFTPELITAMVREGQLDDPRAERALIDLLLRRRRTILEQAFTELAPLDKFQIVRRTPGDATQSLCFEDLAVLEDVVDWRRVTYKMRFMGGEALDQELGWLQFAPDAEHPHRACVVLPVGVRRPSELAPKDAPDDHPLRYGVLRIFVNQEPAVPPNSSLELHLYDLGAERGFRLVGLVRPPRPELPGLY